VRGGRAEAGAFDYAPGVAGEAHDPRTSDADAAERAARPGTGSDPYDARVDEELAKLDDRE